MRGWLRRIRSQIFRMLALRRIGSHAGLPTIHGRTRFTRTTHLGYNTHFNGMSVRGCGVVRIGDHFHSGPECIIISEIHNYRGNALPYDHTMIARDVTIGHNVWLGTRVMVLGGVTIGDGAIIQAGSVVVSDIPAMAIAGGHPARVFAQRDPEHYRQLREQQVTS
ncbi:acyltransferase [Chitinilyticum piscinae]|uniref:Acyltransferase n=1 Tax=Chitinilyticum piscinae TaxID=2866724 RepID=A0A8J7FU72_9NEIS|nr:acyltransferase [Chitinilyticum piscinae]MBE9610656.1 acyltransferase [Chitinilyticum piscinae]